MALPSETISRIRSLDLIDCRNMSRETWERLLAMLDKHRPILETLRIPPSSDEEYDACRDFILGLSKEESRKGTGRMLLHLFDF